MSNPGFPIPITKVDFKKSEYFTEKVEKKQIVIHHSAGTDDVRKMFKWWESTPERVATAFGINDFGQVFQAFEEHYWSNHLYVRSKGNSIPEKFKNLANAQNLEKITIGIEIANWGPLTYSDKSFWSWAKAKVPQEKVYDFGEQGFRGFRFYERYTDNEVGALKLLLKYLAKKENIPIQDIGPEIFEINHSALEGKPGIFTHCAYRTDKTDVVPQEHLLQMLKTL